MPEHASFDAQAGEFDDRAGLTAGVARQVAAAIQRLAGLRPGEFLLECGAGTGEIGVELCRLGLAYRGFDLSERMLEVFARRLGREGAHGELARADGNLRWPAEDRSVRAVFGSRAFHLLEPEHVVAEVARLAAPDGVTFLAGRVRREEHAMRAQMQRQMRRIMKDHGCEPRPGERAVQRIVEGLAARGAERIGELEVAAWAVISTPEGSLQGWRGKEGLAGVDPPPPLKAAILAELEAWAVKSFGSLLASVSSTEVYVLQGARVPA